MERKSNTENLNPFPTTPNNNVNFIPFSENEKFNKLFCHNNNSSKLIASKILSQVKNSYSSNPNKNKIIFPNKINELEDLKLNDSPIEIKSKNDLDNKKIKSNSNYHTTLVEIKSYNFKQKENVSNNNKCCISNKVDKDSNSKSILTSNKLNNLTDQSLINMNNNSLIKNNKNTSVQFNFSSNSKDKDPNYSNSNIHQFVLSNKIKSNEFSRINVTEKDNKQLINFNKIKESQNKKIDNYLLKDMSKYYTNLKPNKNSYLIKNEYLIDKDKIRNKIPIQENNKNIIILKNMNRYLGNFIFNN